MDSIDELIFNKLKEFENNESKIVEQRLTPLFASFITNLIVFIPYIVLLSLYVLQFVKTYLNKNEKEQVLKKKTFF
eukprot:EC825028.1.p1 GENE.EC825028.1~~EC825028.1.p1  ORF type:complete len:76 (+),score=22.91 EC825028.1:43-270(+)